MTVSSPNVIEIKLDRLIDDGSECNFLDKAVVGSRPFGD